MKRSSRAPCSRRRGATTSGSRAPALAADPAIARTPAWILAALALAWGPGPALAAAQTQESARVVNLPSVEVTEHAPLAPAPGWPLWLKDFRTLQRTDRTAGIAFAGRDEAGRTCFFLADGVGAIHLCRVEQPGDTGAARIELEPVAFGESALEALADQERWDFSALALARADLADTLSGVLAVTGHGLDYAAQTRVLNVSFTRGGGRWRMGVEGAWVEGARFWEPFVFPGGGLTGLGLGERYTYLGLTRLVPPGELNTRGTMIFVYDHEQGQVARVITRRIGVQSVGGMHAPADSVLVVADRDRRALSVIRWDAQGAGQVVACDRFPLELLAPGGFRYAMPAIEGLTIDDLGDFWCVVGSDPRQYRPLDAAAPETLHVYMAAAIPILYRFPGARIWDETGLSGLWQTGRR